MAISFCLTWRNSKQELHENLCHHLFLPQKTGYFWGSLRRLRKVKRFEWRIRCWFFFFNFLPTYRWEFDFLCWAIYEDSALDDLGLLEWFLTKIFCLPLPVISRVVTLFIYTGWNPRLPIYFRPFIDVNNHTLIAGCLGRHPRWFPSPLGKPAGRPGILRMGGWEDGRWPWNTWLVGFSWPPKIGESYVGSRTASITCSCLSF